jgi:cytochrome c
MNRPFIAILLTGATLLVVAAETFRTPVEAGGAGQFRPILAGSAVPSGVRGLLERSCANCHSENTKWPWYSRVYPVSQMILNDVRSARGRMNISRWAEYGPEQRRLLLTRLAAEVRTRQMPPARYTLLHPDARLSDAERNQISQWAHAERRRADSNAADGDAGVDNGRP